MARGLSHFVQVIRLAARPQAFLAGRGAAVGHRHFAGVIRFELNHARARKQQRGIIAGNQRVGAFHYMTAFAEKIKITGANIITLHRITLSN